MTFQKGHTTNIGRKRKSFTEEHKQKISQARQGKPTFFGKHHSEETKKKMSEQRRGRILSEEWKRKIGLAGLGRYHTEETKNKIRNKITGLKRSQETIAKFLKNKKSFKGEDNPNWKGGITPEYLKIRACDEAVQWRKSVFERDNYTCQKCGDNRGHNLRAHHIKSFTKYPELRFDTINGITLCEKCHISNGLHKKQLLMA